MAIKKIPFENFLLEKVKITGTDVLISYYDSDDTNTEQNPTSANRPHPNLISALNECNEIMAKSLGNLKGWDFAREAARHDVAPGGLLEQAKKGYDDRVNDHNVSGLKIISGTISGVQITGSVKSDNGSTGLAAPSIIYDKVDYGHEAMRLADAVKERVYAFLFKGEFVAPEVKEKKKKKTEEDNEDPAQVNMFDGQSPDDAKD